MDAESPPPPTYHQRWRLTWAVNMNEIKGFSPSHICTLFTEFYRGDWPSRHRSSWGALEVLSLFVNIELLLKEKQISHPWCSWSCKIEQYAMKSEKMCPSLGFGCKRLSSPKWVGGVRRFGAKRQGLWSACSRKHMEIHKNEWRISIYVSGLVLQYKNWIR